MKAKPQNERQLAVEGVLIMLNHGLKANYFAQPIPIPLSVLSAQSQTLLSIFVIQDITERIEIILRYTEKLQKGCEIISEYAAKIHEKFSELEIELEKVNKRNKAPVTPQKKSKVPALEKSTPSPQEIKPEQTNEDLIRDKASEIFKTYQRFNVVTEFQGARGKVIISGVSQYKLQPLKALLTPFFQQYKIVQKGNGYEVILEAKKTTLSELFKNNKFLLAASSTTEKTKNELDKSIPSGSLRSTLQEANWTEWQKQLIRLSFDAKVKLVGKRLILDFRDLHNSSGQNVGTYRLKIRPPKTPIDLNVITTNVDVENQIVSRLTRSLALKRIHEAEELHKFVFEVYEYEPNIAACNQIHADIDKHYDGSSKIIARPEGGNGPKPYKPFVIPAPPSPQEQVELKEKLIQFIRDVTGDSTKDFGWLVKNEKTKKYILTWDVRQQQVINLNGVTLSTKEFFSWLCKSIGKMKFIRNLPGNRAGIRIDGECLPYLNNPGLRAQIKHGFEHWSKEPQRESEEDLILEGIRDLFYPTPPVQRDLIPPMPNWEAARAKLNPQDPIIPHAESLALSMNSRVDMSNLTQLREWQLHFIRFVHYLRERYQLGCPGDETFLTDLRTVVRHCTLDLDWESNEQTLLQIVQFGFHFLCCGFDNHLSNFKSLIGRFNSLYMKRLDSKNAAGIDKRMQSEMQFLKALLHSEQPSKTAVIMTTAVIGKLARLRENRLKPNNFESRCMEIRAQVGHDLSRHGGYAKWEQDNCKQIQTHL